MKYSPKFYAHAFSKALASGTNESLASKRLRGLLEKNGDKSHASSVLEYLEKLIAREVGGRIVRVEFAHAMNADTRRKVLDKFEKNDRVTTSVNPNLIAGLRININDEQELDVSLLGKLKNMLA